MKRGTIVKCIKDVIMSPKSEQNPNERMFTEGKHYRTYPHVMQDGWDLENVVCAKNDLKERHIIKHKDDNAFFEKHFEVIEIN